MKIRELLPLAANFLAKSVIRNSDLKDTVRVLEGKPLMLVSVLNFADGVKVAVL